MKHFSLFLLLGVAAIGYCIGYYHIRFFVCQFKYAISRRKTVCGDVVTTRESENIREHSKHWKQYKSDAYNDADHIIDNIYLGNVCAAHNESWLEENSIDVVINMAREWVEDRNIAYLGVEYLPFAMEDTSAQDKEEIRNYVARVTDHLLQIDDSRNVLVHCNMGISRSTSIVIRYLQLKHFMSYDEAYEFIKTKRPVIMPNRLFRSVLRSNGSTSSDDEEEEEEERDRRERIKREWRIKRERCIS